MCLIEVARCFGRKSSQLFFLQIEKSFEEIYRKNVEYFLKKKAKKNDCVYRF